MTLRGPPCLSWVVAIWSPSLEANKEHLIHWTLEPGTVAGPVSTQPRLGCCYMVTQP